MKRFKYFQTWMMIQNSFMSSNLLIHHVNHKNTKHTEMNIKKFEFQFEKPASFILELIIRYCRVII